MRICPRCGSKIEESQDCPVCNKADEKVAASAAVDRTQARHELRQTLVGFIRSRGRLNKTSGCVALVTTVLGASVLGTIYGSSVAIPAIVIALIVVVSNLVYQRVKGPLNTNVIAAVARIEQHYGLVPGEAFDLLQSDERARLAQARDSIEKANWALEFKNFVGIVWGATILERLKQLETAETRKSAQDYERERVPVELLTGDVVGFAKAMTGDSAISVGAVAFWPNETSSAEKLLGGLAVNLATGGFVGDLSSKAQPFGIIALSATTLWRIEVGYVFNGIELSHASRIKTTGVIGWKRSELRTRRVNDSRHLHLVVSIPSYHSTTAKTVGPDLFLFFPDEFDEAQRRHPFFARVMANRSASVGIAEELRQS